MVPDPQPQSTLLYLSRLSETSTSEVVAGIARSARARNAADGITGLLVFDGSSFAQWVEGPSESIASLLERLRADGRHRRLQVLAHLRSAGPRRFPSWRLGYLFAEADDGGIDRLRGRSGPESLEAFLDMVPELDIGDALPSARPGNRVSF